MLATLIKTVYNIRHTHFGGSEMTVVNKTSITLKILGGILRPNLAKTYDEKMFKSLHVSSRIGRCVIITEYGKRSFKNYGKLIAKEGKKKDENGMRYIIIYPAD